MLFRSFHKSKKIKLSINCSQNTHCPDIDGIQTFRFKSPDSGSIENNINTLNTVTNLIGKAFQQLIPVLIWCTDGCQTAVSVLAAFYIRFTGTPWSTTVRMIQTKYPSAFRPQIYLLEYLRYLEENYKPDRHDIL